MLQSKDPQSYCKASQFWYLIGEIEAAMGGDGRRIRRAGFAEG